MTHAVKLFGDITAERTEKGTIIVRKGDKLVSPYEYTLVRQLTPKCYRLFRPEGRRWDILFANGTMEFGFDEAYALEKSGKKRRNNLIGAMIARGTGIYSEAGDFLAFIPGLHYVVVVDGAFLVTLPYAFSDPYVEIYTMCGDFLARGFLSEALEKAREKAQIG